MEFRVLGPLEVVDDGRVVEISGDRQRALLAFLVVNAGRTLSTDRIGEALWGAAPPADPAKAIGFHIAKLRDALEPGRPRGRPDALLATVPGGYVLRVEAEQIDADRCERMAQKGRTLRTSDPAAAAATFEAALALWRGDPFEGLADAGFASAETARLCGLRQQLIEDRFEALMALGRDAEVVTELEAAVARDPLRERLRGQLMTALYRAGRQADALRVYEDARRILAEDLGIDPSPALQQLQVAILRQDPALEPGRGTASPRNPYKGLRAFDEADSADFFGRETLVRRLTERLAQVTRGGRLLTLVGPSGSGKSSVVRAGLVPALRSGAVPGSAGWTIATMYPGSRPFSELAAALAAVAEGRWQPLEEELDGPGLAAAVEAIVPATAGARLLLVIDQFEELLRPLVLEGSRTAFVGCLVSALAAPGSRLVVVTTLRADRLDQVLLTPELGPLIRDGLEVVTPLGRDDLERAVTCPAEAVGAEVEAGLAAEMAMELERQPAALPLLQYAMTVLFERCAGRRLTREASDAIGGVLGALGQRAEECWQALDAADRETARQVLLRLVAFEGRSAAVRRMPRAELRAVAEDPERVERVVDEFGHRRLLSFDRDPATGEAMVEIGHEALLARWSRLAGWVDEERHDLWMRGRLSDAAAEWVVAGRDRDYLLTGTRLDLAGSWVASTDLRLSEDERAFLGASLAESVRGQAVERARAARERALERRATTRLRALAVVLAVAALVASTSAGALYRQGQATSEQAAIAVARERATVSVAELETDPQLSLLLAIEAADATLDRGFIVDDAMYALHWALQEASVPYPKTNDPESTAPGPGGIRGLILLPPTTLIRLAIDHTDRPLTATECATYLHVADCPAVPAPPAPDRRLDVYTAGGRVPVGRLAGASIAGTTVQVASELPADVEYLLTPFEERVGVRVSSYPLEPGALESMTAAGTLPDVAIISRPADVASAARSGHLVDLGGYLDVAGLRTTSGDRLVDLGMVPGPDWPPRASSLYGVPIAVSSGSLIWYPSGPFEAAGYSVPETWAGLLDLSKQIVADGGTPWCLGTEEGPSSGASAVDWIEELVLHDAGPAVYDAWTDHLQAFDSVEVGEAFEAFRGIAFGEGFVDRGHENITHVSPRFAALPMEQDPPGCWLDLATTAEWASWPQALRHEVNAFWFPGPVSSVAAAVRGEVDMVVAFRDRPEVRRVVEELTGAEFAAALASDAESTGLLPADGSGPQVGRTPMGAVGERLRAALAAGAFRVDASDRMPGPVAARFQQVMLEWLSAERQLGPILRDVDAAWEQTTD